MRSQSHRSGTPARLASTWSAGYRYYVLVVLTVCYLSNAVDRSQVLASSLQAIKREFHASDFQLGVLSGLPFALFYSTLAVPLGVLADRFNRRSLLAVAVAAWSAMTALCGLSVSFVTLFAARVGTAIGEAGGSPPSHSLISDYFPPSQRGMAFSIFALGVPFGTAVGAAVGGWGNQHLGWRATFLLAALPGLGLAALVRGSVAEPVRDVADSLETASINRAPAGLRATLAALWSQTSFRYLCAGMALHSMVWYATGAFNNAFLQRSHGMTPQSAGYWISLFAGAGGVGTLLGGFAADRFSERFDNPRWYFWVPAISMAVSLPLQGVAYLESDTRMALTSFVALTFLSAVYFGPSFAMTQALAPLRMRAVATSALLFVQTLIGQGLGPSLVGIVSDHFASSSGASGLGQALFAVGLTNAFAAACYLAASRTVRANLRAATLGVTAA